MVKAVFVKCSVTSENKNTSQKFLPSNILFHVHLQKQYRLYIKLFLKIYSLFVAIELTDCFNKSVFPKFLNAYLILLQHILYQTHAHFVITCNCT